MGREKFKSEVFFTQGMRTVQYNGDSNVVDTLYILRQDVIKMVGKIHDEINDRLDALISETKYTQDKNLVVSKILALKKDLA